MPITICNEGEKLLLEAMVGRTAAGSLQLKLFTNNVTPSQIDTVATYVELVPGVQGYAAKILAPATWAAGTAGTGTGTALANKAAVTYPQQSWSASGTGGAQTVYGYFVTDNAGAVLIGAEKFASSATFSLSGDLIKIDPKLTLSTE